ncbi:hypothetical protein RUND412_010761 [Rhizina undulata]
MILNLPTFANYRFFTGSKGMANSNGELFSSMALGLPEEVVSQFLNSKALKRMLEKARALTESYGKSAFPTGTKLLLSITYIPNGEASREQMQYQDAWLQLLNETCTKLKRVIKPAEPVDDDDLLVLHRIFLWADRIGRKMDKALSKRKMILTESQIVVAKKSKVQAEPGPLTLNSSVQVTIPVLTNPANALRNSTIPSRAPVPQNRTVPRSRLKWTNAEDFGGEDLAVIEDIGCKQVNFEKFIEVLAAEFDLAALKSRFLRATVSTVLQ